MRMLEVVTWGAGGLAILAVGLACWQLWRARQRAAEVTRRVDEAREVAAAAERNATKAEQQAATAHEHARWAWDQVQLAHKQLEQAQLEHHDSAKAEQWEWAYALTMRARELVDATQELVRVALDKQVAPHYRMAAQRHYNQGCQRWQDTMIKALARARPSLEIQQRLTTFVQVHERMYGQMGLLFRAAETDTLAPGDQLTTNVIGASHELESTRRALQRTISESLSTPPPGNETVTMQRIGPETKPPAKTQAKPAHTPNTNGASATANGASTENGTSATAGASAAGSGAFPAGNGAGAQSGRKHAAGPAAEQTSNKAPAAS